MSNAERILYSCVVDAVPALYHQVQVWVWSAIDLAGIDPTQLVVHAVEGCDDRLRRDLERLGVLWVPVRRFPYGTPMCNKLVQLESAVLLASDRVVLSDCDLAWCAPIDRELFADRPSAKVVDVSNPPIEWLMPLFREAGFPHAATSSVSVGGAPTYHNNCNGGLYLMPGGWIRRLQEPWPRWLRWVSARTAQLGPYGAHAFQISFALAMEELGATVTHLPLEYNVPTHLKEAAGCPLAGAIRALHFHRAFDAAGLLLPTGMARVDGAIDAVNGVIRKRAVDAWWLEAAAPGETPVRGLAGPQPDTVVLDVVHGRFRTRRVDHVTRQLQEFGAHTRNELAMVLSFLRPGDQVIDVGAHIGTFTVPIARTVGDGGRVFSIEPGPDAFALLQDNVALNGVAGRVRASCALVTEQPGRYAAVRIAEHTSATYYMAAEHAPTIACLCLDALATHLEGGRPLRLIKIDVEGMELSVLRSGEQLLRTHRPLLYLEVVAAQLQRYGVTVGDIEAFLIRHGYVFFRNVGARNSTNDDYQMVPVAALADGGTFFDCLAIPRERVSLEMTARAQST